MRRHTNKYLHFLLRKSTHSVLFGMLAISLLSWYGERSSLSPAASVVLREQLHGAPVDERGNPQSYEGRVHRLQKRVRKAFGKTYDLATLQQAVETRIALLRRSVTVTWDVTTAEELTPWVASVGGYPTWVKAEAKGKEFTFVLDGERIATSLSLEPPPGITLPKNSTLTDVKLENGVYRAVVDGDAEPGYALDAQKTASVLLTLLGKTGTQATLPLEYVPGRIINASAFDLGPLQYLTSGLSNFEGSGNGRISNVRKGLSELMDNIVVPPGAEFSFNRAVNDMNVPGWKDAFVIVNGKELVLQPGGGICQVATTVYRAALNWGLPIMERANHSLFVTYYMKYGVGIDATIYPKRQDLTFINNTGHYILMQAYSKGFEATVNLYGKTDGRRIVLQGPFFQTNASEEFLQLNEKPLRGNEIGWIQRVVTADGFERQNVVLSRYLSVPSYVKERYAKVDEGKYVTLLP